MLQGFLQFINTVKSQSYNTTQGSSWPWSYGSWIYNYLCNQCLSPLMLWVQFSIRARWTTLCDKVCQWLASGRWFSPGPPVSSTNKTDRHDITEILLKVALNTIKQTNKIYNTTHSAMKKWLYNRGDLSCGEHFYYLGLSGNWWEWPYKSGGLLYESKMLYFQLPSWCNRYHGRLDVCKSCTSCFFSDQPV